MTNYRPDLDLAFHALADRTRRAIVMRLAKGEASVSELARPFEMAMPTLLQHIRVLERGGLITTEKRGRVRTCSIRPQTLAATTGWLDQQRTIWEARLDRMEAYVAQLHAQETTGEKRRGKRKL